MIVRIWHGWTPPEHADQYETLLSDEIIPGIMGKNIPRLRKIEFLKRLHKNEAEFTTMMWFDDLESVKQFAGENYETAYVPDLARNILTRFDQIATHHERRRSTPQ